MVSEAQMVQSRVARGRSDLLRRVWFYLEGLPTELRSARLVLSETKIRTALPVPLEGIPDQVFETADGYLVIVDTKTRSRDRVTISDVVQISTYALILAYMDAPRLARRRICGYGYIRVVSAKGVRYHRVGLLPPAEVIALWCAYWKRQAETGRIPASGIYRSVIGTTQAA